MGSVGTAAGVALMQGEGCPVDYIFLQIKEANKSVLERYLGRSEFAHSGERVDNGQRLIQAAADMFLGWTTGQKGRTLYIRQLMDLKESVPVEELDAVSLEQYAEVCAYVLARAHARTGDPAVIHGYLGKSEEFDEALVRFSFAYQKQNEQDHAQLRRAVDKGLINTATPETSDLVYKPVG